MSWIKKLAELAVRPVQTRVKGKTKFKDDSTNRQTPHRYGRRFPKLKGVTDDSVPVVGPGDQ